MINHEELRDKIIALRSPAQAVELVSILFSKCKRAGLSKTDAALVVRGTLEHMLEELLEAGTPTHLHPGHLYELLVEPLLKPFPVSIGKRMQITLDNRDIKG